MQLPRSPGEQAGIWNGERFPPIPGHGFPDASGKWLPSALGGERLIHRHPKITFAFLPQGDSRCRLSRS